eukprot:scaffold385_cov305-Pinguiococcus_pyrenoidosus.AAC.41
MQNASSRMDAATHGTSTSKAPRRRGGFPVPYYHPVLIERMLSSEKNPSGVRRGFARSRNPGCSAAVETHLATKAECHVSGAPGGIGMLRGKA